jgi:hypothetical protein
VSEQTTLTAPRRRSGVRAAAFALFLVAVVAALTLAGDLGGDDEDP